MYEEVNEYQIQKETRNIFKAKYPERVLIWIDEYGEQLLRGCPSHPHSCDLLRRNQKQTSMVTPLADSNHSPDKFYSAFHFLLCMVLFHVPTSGKQIWFGTLISWSWEMIKDLDSRTGLWYVKYGKIWHFIYFLTFTDFLTLLDSIKHITFY